MNTSAWAQLLQTGPDFMKKAVCVQFLTHVRLRFCSCGSWWCSSHVGEADVVVGSVLWWSVGHRGPWCFRWGLMLCTLGRRLPLSPTSGLPWGEASAGMPASRGSVLRRGSRTLGGAHGWKCSSSTSRCGGLAGESWTTLEWTHRF